MFDQQDTAGEVHVVELRLEVRDARMASGSSPRAGQGEFNFGDGGREDISVEDEYIYDDYDSEPLLTSQLGTDVMRRFQGKKYSLVMRDRTEANTVIPMKYRCRRFIIRTFVVLFLCGAGGTAGYFISESHSNGCYRALVWNRDLQRLHAKFVDKISSAKIESFSR